MSFRPLVEKQVLGGFAFVVLEGEVVDAVTVSSAVKPDTDPLENWKQLGCIKSVAFEVKTKDYTTECPSETGGYSEEPEVVVIRDSIILESDHMSDIVQRLQFGLTGAPTPGTTQSVFQNASRKLKGWLKLQGRKLNGTDMILLDVWCEITLKTAYKFQNGLTANALEFRALTSAGNGIEFN